MCAPAPRLSHRLLKAHICSGVAVGAGASRGGGGWPLQLPSLGGWRAGGIPSGRRGHGRGLTRVTLRWGAPKVPPLHATRPLCRHSLENSTMETDYALLGSDGSPHGAAPAGSPWTVGAHAACASAGADAAAAAAGGVGCNRLRLPCELPAERTVPQPLSAGRQEHQRGRPGQVRARPGALPVTSTDGGRRFVWPADTYGSLGFMVVAGAAAESAGYVAVVVAGLLLRQCVRLLLIWGEGTATMALMQLACVLRRTLAARGGADDGRAQLCGRDGGLCGTQCPPLRHHAKGSAHRRHCRLLCGAARRQCSGLPDGAAVGRWPWRGQPDVALLHVVGIQHIRCAPAGSPPAARFRWRGLQASFFSLPLFRAGMHRGRSAAPCSQ